MKVRYTPEFIAKLHRLRDFIAIKNPVAAQRIATQLLAGSEKLKLFPKIGVQVLGAPQPKFIRDLFIGNYTARYLISSKDEIIILRLWHSKDIENDL